MAGGVAPFMLFHVFDYGHVAVRAWLDVDFPAAYGAIIPYGVVDLPLLIAVPIAPPVGLLGDAPPGLIELLHKPGAIELLRLPLEELRVFLGALVEEDGRPPARIIPVQILGDLNPKQGHIELLRNPNPHRTSGRSSHKPSKNQKTLI